MVNEYEFNICLLLYFKLWFTSIIDTRQPYRTARRGRTERHPAHLFKGSLTRSGSDVRILL